MTAQMAVMQIAVATVREHVPKEGTLRERVLETMRYVRQCQNDIFFMSYDCGDG
jgi:hypothetical protein